MHMKITIGLRRIITPTMPVGKHEQSRRSRDKGSEGTPFKPFPPANTASTSTQPPPGLGLLSWLPWSLSHIRLFAKSRIDPSQADQQQNADCLQRICVAAGKQRAADGLRTAEVVERVRLRPRP